MVFLGYILPPENQKVYNDDVALALSNYKKDLINASLEKMPQVVQQKLIDLMNIQNTTKSNLPTAIDDLTKLLNPLPPPPKQPLTVQTTGSTGPTPYQSPSDTIKIALNLNPPTEKMYPSISPVVEPLGMEPKIKMTPKEMAIASAKALLSEQVKRQLTPEEENDISNKVEMQGRLSNEVSSNESTPNPSPTDSLLTIGTDTTISSLVEEIKKLKDIGKADKEVSRLTNRLIKELFIREIKDGKTLYGATSNAQKTKEKEKIIQLNDKDQLEFSNGKSLKDKHLSVSLKINLGLLEGKGIKGRGMSAVNGEKNFGDYHLSLLALRKGNLSIYRPKSNSIVVSRRNMSPTLIKIINEIKSTMKFNLDDYDRLKVIEQKVVDHVINLLRMDYPPKMKRALDEENWNLKQRYEILLSEINAGNGGFMVINELKDILAKLKENKVINDRKYKLIISALE